MARGDQLSRQWRIIQHLMSSRIGKSVADLSADLDCHPRTVYRDLAALEGAGFPLYTEKVEGTNRWAVLDAARQHIPIPFSLTELMSLWFSRGFLTVLKGSVFYDSLETLFQKIKTTLPPQYLEYLERIDSSLEVAPKPYKPFEDLNEALNQISRSIAENRVLEIQYYAMSRQEESRRKVEPYKIWLFEDSFYLIGGCRLRGEVRMFALDRIKSISETDEHFSLPEGLDLDRRLESSFGVFSGETESVEIRFSKNVAGYIREKIWHKTQEIKDLPGGAVLFRAHVAGLQEIKHWVMKWGAHAEVVSPETLRIEICNEAAAILNQYR